ncbi:MAG: ribosome silencing factor [Candidatus Omnitrophica bacterium]|nr:ribosome silencing factor [Candidatus Omnitrophota bacterium]
MHPKRIALLALEAADAKQAVEPVVLDVSRLTSVAHYFMIAHGNSDRHVRAIAQNIQDELEKHKIRVWHTEGMSEGRWVLLDYGSIIVHVFYRELRDFYGLERLWGNAPQIRA